MCVLNAHQPHTRSLAGGVSLADGVHQYTKPYIGLSGVQNLSPLDDRIKEEEMTEEEARKLAEAHWGYTYKILMCLIELVHVQSVETMIHGIKHGQAEVKK